MTGNGYNGWKQLNMAGYGWNIWKWLQFIGKGWTWLNMAGNS